ncbi:uncharacterized protein K452DRAFT_230078 [Aplosporella prunicola CBS 121167]|uniref:UEV domain-containing protein n=1 Tax=Aplosporella prunicola CBS 121167 TaxID=1176127 RepID=A0A6A6BB24_9PEZI|nr:uncharacterized protein K452DRAFT_230078 [Aplosporella prunicola CBS 121167]KAF2140563.1 hypothetical protein K452DRAFT_230078 [Aplosporella prunicola CBS 121167]
MPPVSDRVLNWLYSVLTNEYLDVKRTYTDVADALGQYPSLAPKTEVYTYENGAPALLLLVSGTVPVQFRGAVYRFPVAIWVPQAYPREPPMVYVEPSRDMLVRPGQHVSADGRVYHPYLSGWGQFWDKSSLVDFLTVLRGVFAKEPPVVAKQPEPAPPAVPPPPDEWRRSMQPQPTMSPAPMNQATPPPPPPKPPKQVEGVNGSPSPYPNGHVQQQQHQAGPPLPPLPPGMGGLPSYGQQQHMPQRQASLTERPLPPTPQSQMQTPHPFQAAQFENGTPASPNFPHGQYAEPPLARYQQPPPLPPQQAPYSGSPAPMPPQYAGPPLPPNAQYPGNAYPPQAAYMPPAAQTAAQPAPPTMDLLTSPLDVTLPSQNADATPLPVPPVPPNPQKDALLRALSTALRAQTIQATQDNAAAIAPLQAQQAALRAAHAKLQGELDALTALQATLDTNERVLRGAMGQADRVMEEARGRTVPDVDDVLVAPTVVGEQLWRVVAEERALGEAIFVLGRGLDSGRVGAEGFVRQTRSLAREQFLKKALIKKIAKGMGLDEDPHGVGARGFYS